MSTDFTASARWLSEEYRGKFKGSAGGDHLLTSSPELNGTTIEILDEPPSALEFARLVHISRPVIVKGVDFPALRRWTPDYIEDKLGDRPISVAVTPNGLADAIAQGPDGLLYFAEPLVEKMPVRELFRKLGPDRLCTGEIHYLQSQNGNLFSPNGLQEDPSEFEPLMSDVPREIPWCSEALGQGPDAVNIWIGDDRSVTSVHSDPYENIYTVVQGEKHFFLLPPADSWCLKERLYPHASYKRKSSDNTIELVPSQEDVPLVRWSSILDPEAPDALPEGVVPIKVTLHAGESLYLPVGWWHYVRQSNLTIALNWWYDAEMRGMSWVMLNFLRNTKEILSGNDDLLVKK